MNNPLQTAKQALESANEIIIHLLENHPTARHHRKTGEALRQVNDAIQAIAHAENLKSEKSIENNQANSFRGSPDHIADAGNMAECRHCGFLCKPNTEESRSWYPLKQPKFIPVGIVNDHHSITWMEEIVDDQAPIGAILYALQDSVGRNVSFAKEQK